MTTQPPQHPIDPSRIRTEISPRDGTIVVYVDDVVLSREGNDVYRQNIPLVQVTLHALWTGDPNHDDDRYEFSGDDACPEDWFTLASWEYGNGGFDDGNFTRIWAQPVPGDNTAQLQPSNADLRRLFAADLDEPDKSVTMSAALDEIATMLQDPEWGVGMLEDIAGIVSAAGFSVETQHDADGEGIQTWDRH